LAVRCNVTRVTGRSGTAADRAVLNDVEALGQTVTPRQLKRWRQALLVPSPERPGAGRGHGRPSLRYPDGTTQVVAQVAGVLQAGYSLHDAALALFLAELTVPEDLVRRALLEALDIAPEVQSETHPDRRIDLVSELGPIAKRRAKAHPLVRHWSRQSYGAVMIGPEGQQARGRPPEVMNEFPYSVLSPALLGEVNIDGRAALGHVLGVDVSEVPELEEQLKLMNLDALREAARSMPIDLIRRGVVFTASLFAEAPTTEPPNYAAGGLISLALAVQIRESEAKSAIE